MSRDRHHLFTPLFLFLLLYGPALPAQTLPPDFPPANGFDPALIRSTTDATEAIPLFPGIHLLSLPEEPTDPDPAAVLAAVAGAYARVATFDGCAAQDGDPQASWKTFDPDDPEGSDLTTLDHRQGFWITATDVASLPSDGVLPATTSIPLCKGWNLIGFPSAKARPLKSALQSIEGKYERLFAYDATTPQNPWRGWDVNAPAWAIDLDTLEPGKGYWLLVTEDVTLEIKNAGEAPTVAFTSPADLDVITAPTDLHGTVASELLDHWTLSYRAVGDAEWIELDSAPYPVEGKLGTFDPTLLLNGLYELKLEAVDLAGMAVEETIAVVVEGNMKIGHFTLRFVDLALPLAGLDIEVIRTYDSRQRHRAGDFGPGWTLDIRQGSYRNNRPPGDGWRIPATDGPWGLPCSAVQETRSHLTTVRLSDQEIYRFRLVLRNPATVLGGCFAEAAFEWVDGPLPGTTLEILGGTQVFAANGSDVVVVPDTQEPFVPRDVKLTTRDGRIFHLDLEVGVTHLEDLNGNTLDITAAGITHSSGRGVEFVRDDEGRIGRIVDPLGQANIYNYDAQGDQVSMTDRAGATTRFLYRDHYLEEVENALGVRAVRTEYDAAGRVVRMIDAAGAEVQLEHDLAGRRELVTDRLGHLRVLHYDEWGNVVREVDETGAVTLRSFAERGLLLRETDPLGNVRSFTYTSAGDRATSTDALGRMTSYAHDDRGRMTRRTDALGRVHSAIHNDRGQLVELRDAAGAVHRLTHDPQGNLATVTDALDQVTSFSYDTEGHRIEVVDASGQRTHTTWDTNGRRLSERRTRTRSDGSTEELVTSFEYDPVGRHTATIAPDGSRTTMEYDALGRLLRQSDELGRVTTYQYDAAGRLTRIVHPDGSEEGRTWDAEGRLLARSDEAGRETTFTYDPAGRLLTTTFPDGATVRHTWDAAGRLLTTTDPRGFTTAWTWDATGRPLTVTDAHGGVERFTWDEVGQPLARTDARGQTTRYTWDLAGRRTRITHPDGSSEQSTWDLLGQLRAETDAAGLETRYDYDALGRLTAITDALGQISRTAYNEVGWLVVHTDARGHQVRFEHDARGRVIRRLLHDGSAESFTHHADGTLASHTDFRGLVRTFTWDARRRLLRRDLPDGTAVTFTYTPTGQRATATDSRGTTHSTWDARDRLLRKVDPSGHELTWEYDLAGNVLRSSA